MVEEVTGRLYSMLIVLFVLKKSLIVGYVYTYYTKIEFYIAFLPPVSARKNVIFADRS